MEKIIWLDSVDSTNDYLKALAQAGAPAGTMVIAKTQTAGRGRMGRSFLSREGGVYLSLLLRPGCPLETANQLTAWTAVAVSRAVERVSGVRPGIKWVNDLILNRRKLAGILTEAAADAESGNIRYAVVGIGVNLGQEGFPAELEDIATSLYMETGKSYSRRELITAMTEELDEMSRCFPWDKQRYLEAYRSGCITLGRSVGYSAGGEPHTATAQEIDESFGLIVAHEDGSRETLRAGEVSVRGLCGYT